MVAAQLSLEGAGCSLRALTQSAPQAGDEAQVAIVGPGLEPGCGQQWA